MFGFGVSSSGFLLTRVFGCRVFKFRLQGFGWLKFVVLGLYSFGFRDFEGVRHTTSPTLSPNPKPQTRNPRPEP